MNEPEDVITNTELPSDIIRTDSEEIFNDGAQIERLIPVSLQDGQIFFLNANTTSAGLSTQEWTQNTSESSDFRVLESGPQLYYIIPQGQIYDSGTTTIVLSSSSGDIIASEGNSSKQETCSQNDTLSTTESGVARWSEEKTKMLISIVKRHERDFKGRLRLKRSIWQSIANSMASTYKDIDKDLCYKKWSNMLRTFRAFKKRNDRNWIYYDDIDKLAGSIETRCLTQRDVRRRMNALISTKESVKKFLDKTSEIQDRIENSMTNFVQNLKELQKQSDEHVQTILTILEEHFCETEDSSAGTTAPVTCNEMPVCTKDANSQLSELSNINVVYIPSKEDGQDSAPESTYQPMNECCLQLVDSVNSLCNDESMSEEIIHTGFLHTPDSRHPSSSFENSKNQEIVWERLDNDVPAPVDIIDITDECMQDVIQVGVTESPNVQDVDDTGNGQQLFFTTQIESSPSEHSIQLNKELHLLPQPVDGSFQFVSVTESLPINSQSQVFGSLKKVVFSSDDTDASKPVQISCDISIDKATSDDSANISNSETEMVIVPQNQEENDSFLPTTAFTLQLIPGTEETYQLVVCPQTTTDETGNPGKYPDPWNFNVYNPMCHVLNENENESTYQEVQTDVGESGISQEYTE